MRIGLLGFGVVGRGVYELAASRSDMEITRVMCRRALSLPDADVTHNIQDILSDASIDTVVEAIGGLHPAWDYVRAAIESGKNVVTANKAMVAEFYDELIPLVERKGVLFRCTAAVGGGIGWLSSLERARRMESIREISGIMNGTCNYILDSMTRLGLCYDEALSQAQSLGYAEADPTTDVDGIDTWHKLIISSNVAFGVSLEKSEIPVRGIRNILTQDVTAFKEHGLCCKLIATGRMQGGHFSAFVQPALFPYFAPESAVPANFNLITLIGNTSGRQSFFGQGAGRYPTAYNVAEDLADLICGRGFYSPCSGSVPVRNHETFQFYVRGDSDDWLEAHTELHWGDAALTVPVSVARMHQWCASHPNVFMAALPERKDIHC